MEKLISVEWEFKETPGLYVVVIPKKKYLAILENRNTFNFTEVSKLKFLEG